MSKYLKLFETVPDYTAAESTLVRPNVSLIEETNKVKYNPYPDPADLRRVICTYNVTSTSSATKLLGSATGISKQIIDGVEQSSVVTQYTFDTTGEHVVKYEYAVVEQYAINEIPYNAFLQCDTLTSVTVANNIPYIGESAFGACRSLTNVIIPDSVMSIGNTAFGECDTLTSVTVEAIEPPSLGTNAFLSTPWYLKIYVPAESVDTYKSARGWKVWKSHIEAIQTA